MKINKKMQISLAAALLLVCGTAFASQQKSQAGYVGLQLGYGKIYYLKQEKIDVGYIYSSGVDSSGLAGRLYFGYDFNKNFALESGLTFLPKVTFHNTVSHVGLVDLSFNQNALDLLGKVILPLQYNVELYAKAGAAYVITCNYEIAQSGQEVQGDDRYTGIVPVLGAGVNYGFNDHVFADLSYMRYFGKEDSFKPANFIGIGVVYRF